MPELLLEILSEEIPARMQSKAADDFKRIASKGLNEVGLEFSSAESYVTPRRLALVVYGLPVQKSDVMEERKGPRTDAPAQAIDGFKRSLPKEAVIEERRSPKGGFLFATWEEPGRSTRDVLVSCLPKIFQDLPWPKSMRWANHDLRWVRPIHSLLVIFDGQPVPFQFGPVIAGNETRGHRFLSFDPIKISNFSDYKLKLNSNKVMLDPVERKSFILDEAAKLAMAKGLTVRDDPALISEITGLVEWPVVYMGAIDEEFMDVPSEVLITTMKSHQKYLSCIDSKGDLASCFIVVSNTETSDGGCEVIAGNERVLRARLSDAKFFWNQDRRLSLADKSEALKDRVFHAKLGSVADKVSRLESLALEIARYVPDADRKQVVRAAQLAKSDLSSGMVGEFAELQGIMGRYYALNDGETVVVANAIAEHYAPQGPKDNAPTAPISICLAIADKIDNLVGLFAINERPTGSKDPFALRRAALGVIRIILENRLRIPLVTIFSKSHALFSIGKSPANDLLVFFTERLKVHLKEQGIAHDSIEAVFASDDEDDLVRIHDRVNALKEFLDTDDGENLLSAYRRAVNILKIEEKNDGRAFEGDVQEDLFVQSEEKVLHEGLTRADIAIAGAMKREEFDIAMKAVAALRVPVDAFFDCVTVNVEQKNLRENRLRLLNQMRSALDGIAMFSKIER